jgi:hypothetical protein
MKNRLLIALLGSGLGLLLFSASLGLHRGTTTPTVEAAAASIAVAGQQCTSASQVSVSFNWLSYNEGLQWFDLSLSNNGFAPGTFVGIGPLGSSQTSFSWDGILPGLTHFMRINTLTPYGWSVSQTLSFTTRDCQYGQSNIAIVTPNQTTTSYPVNGPCAIGSYMQNGLCYTVIVLNQSFNCQTGSYAYGGTCYYPTGVAMIDGQCAAGGLVQNGQCFAPTAPGFLPQGATCYRGYNQMGQCYDVIGQP